MVEVVCYCEGSCDPLHSIDLGGGRTWAAIATLLQTTKMNDVDPHAWLTQTLERIAQSRPIFQIDALMPWHFKA